MRISELSRRSGVTVPTIKYYLREKLLPPGTPTGRNQAEYDESHLHRLRLVQVLREVGGVSVADIREVLRALDEPELDSHRLMGSAHRAVLGSRPVDRADPARARARADALAWVRRLRWHVSEDAPAIEQLADVILALRRIDHTVALEHLDTYAEAALVVARREVAVAADAPDPASMMAGVVIGTVLGEALLTSIRLLAQEHVSATLTAGVTDGRDAGSRCDASR